MTPPPPVSLFHRLKSLFPNPQQQQQQQEQEVKRRPLLDLSATAAGKKSCFRLRNEEGEDRKTRGIINFARSPFLCRQKMRRKRRRSPIVSIANGSLFSLSSFQDGSCRYNEVLLGVGPLRFLPGKMRDNDFALFPPGLS